METVSIANEIVAKLATALSVSKAPSLPIDIDIWDASLIAAYLKCDRRQVLERYAARPDFPRAIRLPSSGAGKGHPRWRAKEVIAWAESYQEGAHGKVGRPRTR